MYRLLGTLHVLAEKSQCIERGPLRRRCMVRLPLLPFAQRNDQRHKYGLQREGMFLQLEGTCLAELGQRSARVGCRGVPAREVVALQDLCRAPDRKFQVWALLRGGGGILRRSSLRCVRSHTRSRSGCFKLARHCLLLLRSSFSVGQ